MLHIVLADLRARSGRLAGTAIAIVLGVGFLVGTLVLGDTIAANFDDLFSETAAGTDVVVRSESPLDASLEADASRRPLDGSVLDALRTVEGVAVAEPQVIGYGQILGADGDPVGGNGPPRLAGSWITTPELNPYELAEGREPRAADEVVINRGAAEAGDLELGDRTVVQLPQPVEVTIVGISTFGGADGLGQTTMAAFTLDAARELILGDANASSAILVRGEPGQDDDALRDRIARVLPAGVEAVTGADLVDERLDSLDFLVIVRTFLVAFAVIALGVAALSISNTFSITVAHRTRELALLRVVGASSRQLRRLVRWEALIVGAGASLVGVVTGLGVAAVLKGVFVAFGLGLPAGGLTIRPLAVVLGVGVGLASVLIATRAPARRAARVAPIAALRVAATGEQPLARRRVVLGAAATIAGVALALIGSAGTVLAVGVGSALVVAGVLALAPVIVPRFATAAGVVLRRTRGVAGALAEQNVRRQPRRAASTATALTTGVAVVAVVTVLAASVADTMRADASAGFGRADLAIATPAFGGGVLSPDIMGELDAVRAVDDAVGFSQATVLLDGDETIVAAMDAASAQDLLDLELVDGSLADVAPDALVVSANRADDEGWRVGSTVDVTFPDGVTTPMTVGAVIGESEVLPDVVLPTATWFDHVPQASFSTVFVRLADGLSLEEGRAALVDIARRYTGDLQDREEFAAAASAGIDLLMGLVYAMLALAILIAVLGIANALSLAVHERRQEIGLLRALGQTRRQARSTLRLESLVLAVFGTLTGLVVGSAAGGALFAAITDGDPVVLPWTTLASVLLVGVVAGVLAARRPARRAARLDVLDAIAAV